MKSLIFAMALAGAVPLVAKAEGPTNVLGFGASSCRDAVAYFDLGGPAALAVFSWAAGYASGMNSMMILEAQRYRDMGNLVLDGETSDNNGFIYLIVRLCRQQPDRLFVAAVGQIYDQLPLRNWPDQEKN